VCVYPYSSDNDHFPLGFPVTTTSFSKHSRTCRCSCSPWLIHIRRLHLSINNNQIRLRPVPSLISTTSAFTHRLPTTCPSTHHLYPRHLKAYPRPLRYSPIRRAYSKGHLRLPTTPYLYRHRIIVLLPARLLRVNSLHWQIWPEVDHRRRHLIRRLEGM
jgi:hypothetical protein